MSRGVESALRGTLLVNFVLLVAVACTNNAAVTQPPGLQAHPLLQSTLWVQTSSEFDVLTRQAYQLAQVQLDRALHDPTWSATLEQPDPRPGLAPAVIIDVDETVLDNSVFQARLIRQRERYDRQRWASWAAEASASAVRGAIEFIEYARSRGVAVYFVTNRDFQLEEATRRNLQRLGVALEENTDTVLTRGERADWGADKDSRRRHVAAKHRILLLIGDDLNDFVSGARSGDPEQRQALADHHRHHWGTRWIALPNPMYGSWEAALFEFDDSLAEREKLQRKYQRLRTQ